MSSATKSSMSINENTPPHHHLHYAISDAQNDCGEMYFAYIQN